VEPQLKVALVALNAVGYQSLALGYLQSYGMEHPRLQGRVGFQKLDLTVEVDPWWVAYRALALGADVVGFSVMAWNARSVYDACRIIGTASPETVLVLGCGPVGLFAMWAAWAMGAGRVIAVDEVEYRLEFARNWLGVETLNFKDVDLVTMIKGMTEDRGADATIDAVGVEASGSPVHRALGIYAKLEAGSPHAINTAIHATRKLGAYSVIHVVPHTRNITGWIGQRGNRSRKPLHTTTSTTAMPATSRNFCVWSRRMISVQPRLPVSPPVVTGLIMSVNCGFRWRSSMLKGFLAASRLQPTPPLEAVELRPLL
jgi:hypothetical protein